MTNDIKEYYPNGRLKYKLEFYSTGEKCREQYFDEIGNDHNICGPDYQYWYKNGYLEHITFTIHDSRHNTCCPASIWFSKNVKIEGKYYYINGLIYNKLDWQNQIKNI